MMRSAAPQPGPGGSAATPPAPPSPRRADSPDAEAADAAGGAWLISSLDAYVHEAFLPQVGGGGGGGCMGGRVGELLYLARGAAN